MPALYSTPEAKSRSHGTTDSRHQPGGKSISHAGSLHSRKNGESLHTLETTISQSTLSTPLPGQADLILRCTAKDTGTSHGVFSINGRSSKTRPQNTHRRILESRRLPSRARDFGTLLPLGHIPGANLPALGSPETLPHRLKALQVSTATSPTHHSYNFGLTLANLVITLRLWLIRTTNAAAPK